MDAATLLQNLMDARVTAKTKGEAAAAAYAELQATKTTAQAAYDATVGSAQSAFTQANTEAQDASVAVKRILAEVSDALGLELQADPRVRIG